MLNVSFPLIETLWIPIRMNTKRCRREEGTIRTHWNGDCLLEDFSGKNSKYCQLETLVLLYKIYFFVLLNNAKYLYLRLTLLKMKDFRIMLVSLFFNFWWGKGCIKRWKSKKKTRCLLYGWKLEILRNTFWCITFQLLNYSVRLGITDEGSVREMRIWFILLMKSDLKWCIHLSGSLFSYMF